MSRSSSSFSESLRSPTSVVRLCVVSMSSSLVRMSQISFHSGFASAYPFFLTFPYPMEWIGCLSIPSPWWHGEFLSLFLPTERKQNLSSSNTKDDAALPNPQVGKSMHTGSFFFHWPEELSTIGSSISLLGNLHPQITLRNSPFTLWEIGLRNFVNPVIKCLIPQTLETRISELQYSVTKRNQ
jgi:hypothetical protein